MSLSAQEHRDLVASFPRARRAPVYLAAMLICFGIGFGSLMLGSRGRTSVETLLAGGILAGSVFGVMLLDHMRKVRAQSMAIAASRLGLDHTIRPPRKQQAALFAQFAQLKMLRRGHRGLKLWFGGEVDGRRVDLIEHAYVVSTGKSAHTVTHTVAAIPVSASWPRVSLSPRNSLGGWWASVRGKDFKLENKAFNARWSVKTEDPDFALVFLSPEVQSFLASSPSAEMWHVGDGVLCWIVRKQLKPRDIPLPLGRVTALRELLSPELEYWRS